MLLPSKDWLIRRSGSFWTTDAEKTSTLTLPAFIASLTASKTRDVFDQSKAPTKRWSP